MSSKQLYSNSLSDYLSQKTYFGNATIGELNPADDVTIPYRHQPNIVRKKSRYTDFHRPGVIYFQCRKEPPNLLNSYSKLEGLFSMDEVLAKHYEINQYHAPDQDGHYYDAYNNCFQSPENIVKYVKVYGITTTEGLSDREKSSKSITQSFCIDGKLNDHYIKFPANICAGLIFDEEFKPVPNYKLYGKVYVFLAFDKNDYMKFYFTDNPGFTNTDGENCCSPKRPFSMVLKIGWFSTTDIKIIPTIIDDIDYFNVKGFVFCPDYEWSFYYNDNYDEKNYGKFIAPHHPKYIYDEFDFYPTRKCFKLYNKKTTKEIGFKNH